ncbi:MAG: serine/threonine protein kinase [Myxococcales bacterium]|nr:serine/threonine protein kinase [Myxococcales bacterium]
MAEVPWLGRLVASRYRLIARLGEGHIAEVYLARHVLIDRLSAIKVLRPELGRDRGMRKLFLREAKAVNRINHPNIVEITDYGETVDTAYLVMEYVPGEPLSRHLARGPLGWERASRIGLQIGLALSRAHEMGVIHRDIKPSNVLVIQRRGGDDFVKLTDFGVAKLLSASPVLGKATTGLVPAQLTPGYVAPEMLMLGTLDARSDVYSLGVLVYEAATGVLPFAPDLDPRGRGRPRAVGELLPDVPPLFDSLLARLLETDPEERPRDAFEVVAMFRRILAASDAESEELENEPPTERMAPRPRAKTGPKLLTMPFDRIGALCENAFRLVTDCVRESERSSGGREPPVVASEDLDRAFELVEMVRRLQGLVATDSKALAALEERGRAMRSQFGSRLDELGNHRSRAMGWASSAAERSDFVRTQRLSGAHPIPAMDALLWEEATLEHEEEVSLSRADELGREVEELSQRLELANEAIEREKATLEAQLEGHVAALRALAGEAWMVLDALAEAFDLRLPTDLGSRI